MATRAVSGQPQKPRSPAARFTPHSRGHSRQAVSSMANTLPFVFPDYIPSRRKTQPWVELDKERFLPGQEPFRRDSDKQVFESVHLKNAVIASQCSHWRGNPPDEWNHVTITTKNRDVSHTVGQLSIHFPSNRGIATPVCELARNDSISLQILISRSAY